MKVFVVTCSPNEEGLTAACGEAARQGVVDGHSRARVVSLNSFRLDRCGVCDSGWGTCRTQHQCRIEDDFADLHGMFGEAEGYVLVTPVYFGEPSETWKALFDRLRRCEATKPDSTPSVLFGKPAIVIAAAGGSGSGAVHCLGEIERLLRQLGVQPVDFIAVTQRTREYQLETIHDALVAMCTLAPTTAGEEAPEGRKGKRVPPSSLRHRRSGGVGGRQRTH
jgi:multimeric flavodoxin WrbA